MQLYLLDQEKTVAPIALSVSDNLLYVRYSVRHISGCISSSIRLLVVDRKPRNDFSPFLDSRTVISFYNPLTITSTCSRDRRKYCASWGVYILSNFRME